MNSGYGRKRHLLSLKRLFCKNTLEKNLWQAPGTTILNQMGINVSAVSSLQIFFTHGTLLFGDYGI